MERRPLSLSLSPLRGARANSSSVSIEVGSGEAAPLPIPLRGARANSSSVWIEVGSGEAAPLPIPLRGARASSSSVSIEVGSGEASPYPAARGEGKQFECFDRASPASICSRLPSPRAAGRGIGRGAPLSPLTFDGDRSLVGGDRSAWTARGRRDAGVSLLSCRSPTRSRQPVSRPPRPSTPSAPARAPRHPDHPVGDLAAVKSPRTWSSSRRTCAPRRSSIRCRRWVTCSPCSSCRWRRWRRCARCGGATANGWRRRCSRKRSRRRSPAFTR